MSAATHPLQPSNTRARLSGWYHTIATACEGPCPYPVRVQAGPGRQFICRHIQLCILYTAAAGRSRQLTIGVRCVATISRPLSPMPDIANVRRAAVRSPPPYNVLITGSTKGVSLSASSSSLTASHHGDTATPEGIYAFMHTGRAVHAGSPCSCRAVCVYVPIHAANACQVGPLCDMWGVRCATAKPFGCTYSLGSAAHCHDRCARRRGAGSGRGVPEEGRHRGHLLTVR